MCLRLDDMVWLGEVNPLPRQNRWDEMAEQIPREEIDRFATVARYEDLPKAIEKRYGAMPIRSSNSEGTRYGHRMRVPDNARFTGSHQDR